MIHDIALAHGDDPHLRRSLQPYQLKALEAIAACGTPAMGLHVERCDHCGDQRQVPNTCGNRSCPHCQGRERAAWVEARRAELLPVGYFHVVLTLPPDLRPLAKAFPRVVLGLLLRVASDVLDHLCRDPHWLGGEIGQLAVLHTWRRDLGWHPHVHLIVTGGGWDAEHGRWVEARRFGPARTPFLLPVDVLRAAFQRRMRSQLLHAYRIGCFTEGPWEAFPELASTSALTAHLDRSIARPWVLRIEPPFGGPAQLIAYLGAYVNRVAISPKRIIAHDSDAATVTYTWTTNAKPDEPQQATIPASDFLRRFAQHILPPSFQRIRFRGLWSTAKRADKLHLVQRHLQASPPPPSTSPPDPTPPEELIRCPICALGYYQRQPGPCQRPPPRERRRRLRDLRAARRPTMPKEATTAA